MNILVTAFISKGEVDWNAGLPSRHLETLFADLSRQHDSFTVITDTQSLPHAPDNASVIVASPSLDKCLPPLIPALNLADDDEVVVIDVRNPFLSIDHINDFISAYQSGSGPMITVAKAKRSPFYLMRLLDLSAAGSMHVLDQKYPVDIYKHHFSSPVATQPFPFQWNSVPLPGIRPGDAFAKVVNHNGVEWKHVDELPTNSSPSCLYLFEKHGAARAVIEQNGSQVTTLPISKDVSLSLKALQTGNSWQFISDTPPKEGELEIIPFTPQGPQPSHRKTVLLQDGSWTVEIATGIGITGFLFHITTPLESGTPSIIRRFDSSAFWGERQAITGRQQLREVLTASCEIMAGTSQELADIHDAMRNEAVRGFRLPCPHVILAEKRDIMWFNAHIKDGVCLGGKSCK